MEAAGESIQMFCLKSYYTLFTNLENDKESLPEGVNSVSEIAYFFLDLLFL